MRAAAGRIGSAWDGFWFAPQATSTLALVRIAFGLLCVGFSLSLLPDLFDFFSSDGVIPNRPPADPGVWGLLEVFKGDTALVVLYAVLVLSSIALMVGFWSRLAALLVFVSLLSFARRDPWVFNSGDGLVRNLALFLAVAPSGESLSLDRLRKGRDRFWEFPARAPWALRLIQILVSIIYLSTVWQKARGTTWNDGTAVSYAFRLEDLERFPVPSFLTDGLLLSNLQTFGTLAIELSLGVLIWNRALRPYVIGAGLFLHFGIDYSIRVGFFSYAMFVAYLAFLSPDTATRLICAVRDRVRSRRGRGLRGARREREPAGSPAGG